MRPHYMEDPKHYRNRVRELEAILESAGSAEATASQQKFSQMGLASLFGMETTE